MTQAEKKYFEDLRTKVRAEARATQLKVVGMGMQRHWIKNNRDKTEKVRQLYKDSPPQFKPPKQTRNLWKQ